MISIVVADDHHMVRQSIVSLLEIEADIEVVGEASNGQEALRLIREKKPMVALLDVAMPRLNGLETTRRIQTMDVDTRVIMLSMYSDEGIVRRALNYGASGYLLKSSIVDDLLHAIRSAMEGDLYLAPSIGRSVVREKLRSDQAAAPPVQLDQLTPREMEIMQLVVEGHTNSAVAEMLNISTKTVEKHRSALMKKLRVRGIPDLIQVAVKHNLIFLDG